MAFLKNFRLTPQNSKLIFKLRHLLQRSPTVGEGATFLSSNWRTPYPLGLTGVRLVHTSPAYRGLEEFFPKGDVIEEGEETGRQWEARELRQKSNEDLHKLWYILLKERNMLMTVKHEARRVGFIMPAPERMWKVRKSMARIKVVLGERERAIKEAEEIIKSDKRTEQDDKLLDSDHTPSDSHSVAQ